MAHGGSAEWDAQVAAAVEPLRAEAPTALALGMANPETMEAALDTLRDQGISNVAVVRLFISGESFLPQTEYLLGLSNSPPPFFIHHGHAAGSGPPTPIDHGLRVATHRGGLVDHTLTGRILLERARALSRNPSRESVLVLGHGVGDEARNDSLLAAMDGAVAQLRAMGFYGVEVETLREDWPEARKLAVDRIRRYVVTESESGRKVLVLPLRVSGFGPYAEVLDGLDYVPGSGLLPHSEVTDWIRATAASIACSQGWPNRPYAVAGHDDDGEPDYPPIPACR